MDYYYEYTHVDDIEDYGFDEDFTHEEDFNGSMTTFQMCIVPSVKQIGGYVLALVGFSLVGCRLSWSLTRKESVTNSICIISGFIALYITTGYEFLIVLFLSLLAYVLILLMDYFKRVHIGSVMATAVIASHLTYESLWKKPEAWQRIRGIQMVAAMKIISLAFDLERERKRGMGILISVPSLVSFLGYIFCPATSILGPWITYSAHVRSMRATDSGLRWLLWTVANTMLAVFFLSLSNCVVPMLCSNSSWIWLRTYRDALSVRCSHYFICFLSQATVAAAGIDPKLRPGSTSTPLLGHMVTKPWHIEFPRSLSALVRNWNIPMHEWLKMYIFRASQSRHGNYLLAILSTYLVSSLLHGYHIKIYLVLFSLGCFAYAERLLRAKLAYIFDACITATPCVKPCKFKFCTTQSSAKQYLVRMVNIFFSFITVLQLAYLGVMMNDIGDNEALFGFTNELLKWSELVYLGHWIAMFTLVFYYFI